QELVSLEAPRLAILLQKTGGKAKYLREGRKNLYVEPLKIQPCLLIIGAGTVALETAKLTAHCGFSVDIVDDRQDFATHERFPMAHKVLHLPNLHGLLANCEITPLHYVVIMTHSQELDLMALSQILASHAAYIGLLGGSSKRQAIFAALRNEGVPQPELACVHAPIGLNIGAETPEEIAVAVVAELLAAKTDMLAQVKN
ncbi:MAG: XdhC family protein, partial [Desulfovibrionaceae bacterium]|nr:XdhC family protein [Desulfovibrionaceae bacterium]